LLVLEYLDSDERVYGVSRALPFLSVKSAGTAAAVRPGGSKEVCLMTAPGSPTVRRRRLAAELREIRETKGRSGETVAAALRW